MITTMTKFLGAMVVVPLSLVHLRMTPKNKIHARTIRFLIQSLGVVPIKISQWYANLYYYQFHEGVRPVLLKELYALQENCRTHPDAFTHRAIGSYPIASGLVKEWDPLPLASGSIAQIHHATLLDGKEAVLKVRHPGVKRDFEEWVNVLYVIMAILPRLPAWIDPPSVGDILSVVNALEDQLDLRIEGDNLRKYHEWYSADASENATGKLGIKIPEVYFAEDDLLILEYCPKMPTADFEKLSQKKQMELLTCIKLWMYDQVLVRDCIHGDLHDGNWGIHASGGQVVVYDFGMVYHGLSMQRLLMMLLRMDHEAFHAELSQVLSTDRIPLQDIREVIDDYRQKNMIDIQLIQSLTDIFHRQRIPVQSSVYIFLNMLIFIVSLQRSEWMRYSPDQIVKMDLVYARRIHGMEGIVPYLRTLL